MSTSKSGLEAYLVRIGVDLKFRLLARDAPETSFDGYDLTSEQKQELRNPGPGMLTLLGQALAESGRYETRLTGVKPKESLTESSVTTLDQLRHFSPSKRHAMLSQLVKQYGYGQVVAPDKKPQHYDITIVGLGITNIDHITLETEAAIRQANEVLYVDTGVATHAFLESRCSKTTSLFGDSYVEGSTRVEAYEYMTTRVLEAAIEDSPVVFAIQGHPLIFCQPPFLIRNTALALGLSVNILPGISAFDTIACDLGFDPCTHGLQLYEATDLLLRERPLQIDVPALIWQVGSVESRLHTSKVSGAERFKRFQEYLLRFYPAQHMIIGVYSSAFPTMPATRFTFPIAELSEHASHLHPGITLFIPAAKNRPLHNQTLLNDIDDPAHLKSLTSET
jgi:siroheme synthase